MSFSAALIRRNPPPAVFSVVKTMQNAQNRSCNFVHFCRLRSHNYGAIIQPSNETQTTGGTTEAAKEQTGQHDSPGGRIGAADIENRIRTRGKTESATRSGCIQRPGTFQSIRRAKREKRDRKHDKQTPTVCKRRKA